MRFKASPHGSSFRSWNGISRETQCATLATMIWGNEAGGKAWKVGLCLLPTFAPLFKRSVTLSFAIPTPSLLNTYRRQWWEFSASSAVVCLLEGVVYRLAMQSISTRAPFGRPATANGRAGRCRRAQDSP